MAAGEVTIFQPEFVEFGGEERVILSLCRELQAQGKPHAVLCYRDHIKLARYAQWPLKVVELAPAAPPISRVHSLRRHLQRIATQGGPVPMLFNIQSAYHAGLGVAAPYHLRIPDTYRLLEFVPDAAATQSPPSAHTWKTLGGKAIRQFATRRGVQGARSLITNTVALRDEMQALYGRKAEVLYLGGFGSPMAGIPRRATAPIELLTVSRLQTSKRIDWILQALADFKSSHSSYPALRLHIAGTGPDADALKLLSANLGLGAEVVFHGFVSDSDLQDLYARSHVFLMPAKQGYGLPAIEALYQKMGLVVSEESGVVEILDRTNWVAIARGGMPGFSKAVAEMLQRVIRDDFYHHALPDLPEEKSWAIQLIERLQW